MWDLVWWCRGGEVACQLACWETWLRCPKSCAACSTQAVVMRRRCPPPPWRQTLLDSASEVWVLTPQKVSRRHGLECMLHG